jgi:hypothetical protein
VAGGTLTGDLIKLLDSFPADDGSPGQMSRERLRAALGLGWLPASTLVGQVRRRIVAARSTGKGDDKPRSVAPQK